jgi:TolC family type I secretion outer membrane protein
MKSIRSKLCLWSILVVSFSFPLFSNAADQNTPPSETLTMAEAIQIAVNQNPQVKAAGFQAKAVESNIIQARSGFFPQIDFSETFNRTTNPMWAFGTKLNQGSITQEDFDPARLNAPDAISNFATAVSMSWSIYDGGRTKIGWEQAKQNQEIASLMLEQTRQKVIAQTAATYVGLLLAQKNILVLDQALETAHANLKMIESRYHNGFVVKSDLLRAMVRIADLKQQHLQAQSRVEVAKAMLNASMGSPEDKPLNPVTPFAVEAKIKGEIEDWIHTALSKRYDLKTLEHQEEMARKEIDKSRAGHFPDLRLVGNYEIDSEDFSDTADNYTFGAVVKVNLFSGYHITGKTEAAKSFLNRMQEIRRSMELGIRVQTREAFLKARSSWKRIQVAQTAADQAEEGLRIVKNRYNNGLLTIVGLLDAELARQQAHTNYFTALHDYKVARIDLALASGTIDTDFQ